MVVSAMAKLMTTPNGMLAGRPACCSVYVSTNSRKVNGII
jgi:hypothetical protein